LLEHDCFHFEGSAVPDDDIEYQLYAGESPKNFTVFQQYLQQVERGKSMLQLRAVATSITPLIRQSWSARSFTPLQTTHGRFDEVVCNISYHFHKHGQKYGTVQNMTEAALRYYQSHRDQAVIRKTDGLLSFPNGSLYETDGRIVTFVG
jgi:hypothetical protein